MVEEDEIYNTWDSLEDADWQVEDVASVENVEEDRFTMYPEGDFLLVRLNLTAMKGIWGLSIAGVSR